MQLLFQVDQALMVLDQHIQTGCQVDQAVEIQLLFQVDQELHDVHDVHDQVQPKPPGGSMHSPCTTPARKPSEIQSSRFTGPPRAAGSAHARQVDQGARHPPAGCNRRRSEPPAMSP